MSASLPRQNWIDWMKALGMVIIVWGHCFPKGFTQFIYAFSVPVFFLISGFLTRRETSHGEFWKKNFWTLIVPYLILASLKAFGYWLKHIDDGGALYSVGCILFGFGFVKDLSPTLTSVSGCANLWYVYALVLMKIVFQYACRSWRYVIFVAAACVVCQVIFVRYVPHTNYSWAVPAAFGAMPFFVLGQLFSPKCDITSVRFRRKVICALEGLTDSNMRLVLLITSVVFFFITAVVGDINGEAWMYIGEHGDNLACFYLAAISGSIALVSLSLALNTVRLHLVVYISIGTLIILTFHRDVMHPLLKFIENQHFDWITNGLLTLLAAVGVTVVFVPVILIIKHFFLFVLGKRGAK